MAFAHEWFRYERIMVASRCLGGATRLIDDTTQFAKERIVNGHPITEFGAVQAMLADSLTEFFAARSMVYETAKGIDTGLTSRSNTPSARWPSSTLPKWPAEWRTDASRSSLVAAICAKTSLSASFASSE